VVLNGISRVVPVQVLGDSGVFDETLFKSSLSDYMKQKRVNNITALSDELERSTYKRNALE